MDQGGSILWIGDIPAFYIGKIGKNKDNAWQYGAPTYMLGIIPIFASSVKTPVKLTKEGIKLGLKHRWSGIRPILPDITIKTLAESESLFSTPYILLPEKGSLESSCGRLWKLSRIMRWIKRVCGNIRRVGAPMFELEFKKGEEKARDFHRVFPNAWFKNYNEDYPNSGFYRIWDFGPRNLPNWMLEELYTVADKIRQRLENQAYKTK